jgi:hypothetical protein
MRRVPFKKFLVLMAALVFITTLMLANTNVYANFGPTTVWSSTSTQSASYARALRLQYNGANNGKMYATHEIWTSTQSPMPAGPTFPIYESTNGGQSWTKVADVTDPIPGEGLREQGFLFELPQQIGNMPAGTILFAVNAFPDTEQVHNIELYKSNDLCRTWTYVATIASGGPYNTDPVLSDGIWEPFLLVANNKLICYYSDEQDPVSNQMVVHRTSTDGVNWSATVKDVAPIDSQSNLRPGMPTIAKMGNGNYILLYEIVNLPNDQMHFKISSNPENWGDSTDIGTAINYFQGENPGSQPYIVWLPGGGPNGTLVASGGGSNKLFLNYNYGQGHWTVQDSVIPAGYSRSLVPLDSTSIFVIGPVLNNSTGNKDVQAGTMSISPSNNVYNGNLFMLVNRNGKAMDLIGGNTADGAVINQWSYDDNSLNQRWSIIPTGNGHFRLASYVSGKDASVQGDSVSNGAQIVNSAYVEGDTSHQWDLVDAGNGWFNIVNVRSGKYLDVDQNSLNDNAKLQQWDPTGADCQKWRLQPVGDIYIQAKHSGKYIDIGGGRTDNNAPIIQWPFQTVNWFKWRFDNVEEGWYKVTSLNVLSRSISVQYQTPYCILYDYLGGDDEKVRIVPQNDGSFKLFYKFSGLLWDISAASLSDGAQLTQYNDLNHDNQKFYLESSN